MATNRELASADNVELPVPGSTASGDPLVIGALPCVALTDEDADGNAVCQTNGAFRFDVVGNDGNPAAIAAGAIVYLDTGVISSNAGGDRFGYALAVVDSGATTEIAVKIGL